MTLIYPFSELGYFDLSYFGLVEGLVLCSACTMIFCFPWLLSVDLDDLAVQKGCEVSLLLSRYG